MGFVFASLTWLILGDHLGDGPAWLGQAIISFLLPGLFVGMAVSGNIHTQSMGIVALGNFLFYFAATYAVLATLARRRAKSDPRQSVGPSNSG